MVSGRGRFAIGGRTDKGWGVTGAEFEPDEDAEPMSFRRRTAQLLAVASVVLIAGLWAYALFWPHPTTPPGRLDDPTFSTAAAEVCAAAVGQLATLPPAWSTSGAGERAAVVGRSVVLLTAMIDELSRLAPPAGTNDGMMVDEWLTDWRTYIADRQSYADRLGTDPGARFYESIKADAQVSRPIDFFAVANRMDDCSTPADLG